MLGRGEGATDLLDGAPVGTALGRSQAVELEELLPEEVDDAEKQDVLPEEDPPEEGGDFGLDFNEAVEEPDEDEEVGDGLDLTLDLVLDFGVGGVLLAGGTLLLTFSLLFPRVRRCGPDLSARIGCITSSSPTNSETQRANNFMIGGRCWSSSSVLAD